MNQHFACHNVVLPVLLWGSAKLSYDNNVNILKHHCTILREYRIFQLSVKRVTIEWLRLNLGFGDENIPLTYPVM